MYTSKVRPSSKSLHIDIQTMLLAVSVAFFVLALQMFPEEAFRLDRVQHLLATFSFFWFSYFFLSDWKVSYRLILAVMLALAVGFFKEFSDPSFQSLDIAANITGLCLALLGLASTSLLRSQRQ